MTNLKKHFGWIITWIVENFLKIDIVKRLVLSDKFKTAQTAVNWHILLNTADMISHYIWNIEKSEKTFLSNYRMNDKSSLKKILLQNWFSIPKNVTRLWWLAELKLQTSRNWGHGENDSENWQIWKNIFGDSLQAKLKILWKRYIVKRLVLSDKCKPVDMGINCHILQTLFDCK